MRDIKLTRRDAVKGAAATVVVAAAASFDPGAQQALAAGAVVTGYGVTTSQLKDWDIMKATNGIEMQWTGTNADIGTFTYARCGLQ